jgi:hypothetical protein
VCDDVDEALEENAERIDNHEPLPTEQESMKSADDEAAAPVTVVSNSTATDQECANVEDDMKKDGGDQNDGAL